MTQPLPLAQCRVLVTRPEGQSAALMERIRERGGEAWHFPLLAIEPLVDAEPIQACKQRILALDEYRQVIFVSTNAVRFGMQWIEDYWPQLPVGITWHGVGASTCRAMQQAGLPVAAIFTADHPMNSEALLASPGLQTLAGQKILIVRGVGGREHLRTRLTERGARVDVAECYKRAAPATSAAGLLKWIQQQHIGTICINSGDSLQNLCDLLADKLADVRSLRLVVPSQRVAELARARGFNAIVVAANASDKAVVDALVNAER